MGLSLGIGKPVLAADNVDGALLALDVDASDVFAQQAHADQLQAADEQRGHQKRRVARHIDPP